MTHAPSPTPDPSDLPQRLLTGLEKVGLLLRSHAWSRTGQSGLTPTQAQIVSLLASRPDGGTRLSDLAAALKVSAPTASDAVAALAGKGLVEKVPHPTDRRASHLRLTRKGRTAARRAAGWPEPMARAVAALGEDEQRALLASLVKLLRSLEAAGDLPFSRVCPGCDNFRAGAHPGAARPHHCVLLDQPLGDGDVRFDCPKHVPARPRPETSRSP